MSQIPAPGGSAAGPLGPRIPAPGGSAAGPLGPRLSPVRRRIALLLAALAFFAVPAVAGYEVGRNHGSSTTADAASAVDPGGATQVPSGRLPSTGSSGSSSTSRSSVDVQAIADKVDDSVVNITTNVEGGGLAAGTGIVISDTGLVLTNNHVISGTTGLEVEFGNSGVTRSAKVLGYSIVDDVALIQVQNVSKLTAADLGTSSSLSVGDAIVALGNAGGRGGSPTVVSGTVTGLGEEITASDADGTNLQTLDGLIEIAADIRSGDSGGPLVNANGTVVGVTAAASVTSGFGFPGQTSGGQGYAIPIEDALAIVKRIIAGDGGSDIRVGATRAVLGVSIQPSLTSSQRFPGGSSTGSTGGAPVVGVESGSGADKAGLAEGDTIVSVGGRTIATSGDLIKALVPYAPGDTVELTWRTASGDTGRASVKLGEGPPA
ncbi:MAG: trypsin-like peptidase domain-containing protein [Acidimicrobiia bacterium]|jgi:S1-C subfamily serine protease